MNLKRVRELKSGTMISGPVIYWMQRDQRVNDNWAMIYAQQKAIELKQELIIVFNLVPDFLEATIRQYSFMLKGLEKVEINLTKLNIPFRIFSGQPQKTIPKYISEIGAGLLITDFNPLKITKSWKNNVKEKISIPFHEVDAHNIVPCWEASDKLEYAAYTIRPKIHRALEIYLDEFSRLKKSANNKHLPVKTNWDKIYKSLKVDASVPEIDWLKPGEAAAEKRLIDFLQNKLALYAEKRNDPNKEAVSDLSPYLHFGQISAQRVALAAQPFIEHTESQKSFLEELIVRRELSDNFCHYNPDYDSSDGFHKWAKETLNAHKNDKREFIYSLKQWENAETHDPLWNAAQMEMASTGKMHGYMRMYWAKKILEWSASPEEALATAIYLNDKYELDGRDPNGYTGIAWSIGGVHDRAWTERLVFGKIRYMNYNGCKRKFDVAAYINKHT